MNIKQIRELADLVSRHGLTEMEYREGDVCIRLVKAALPPAAQPLAPVSLPAVKEPEEEVGAVDFNRAAEIKSSLIGVFYAAPSPDAPPFVTVGSKVEKGDVLCIIEAMKLMNEIVAERSGEVVDVCVSNGDVVEFGQTLFKLC